jgi:penicillin amidase
MFYFLFAFLLSSAQAQTNYSCETTFDQMNIPHVKTNSLDGFYYCFGLNHGRDRAWMMDFFRRAGQGRNAEVLGFSQLKSDLMMRLLDLPAFAEKLWSNFPLERKRVLEMYSAGVNEGFKTGKNSKEFVDMGVGPEAWKPQHTVLVLLLQSFDQTRKAFFRDYEEEKSNEKWGKEAPALFDEDDMPWENNILKEGEYQKGEKKYSSVRKSSAPIKLWADFPSVFGLETGSNNWAVSSAKSSTGHAIFANDPHLDLKTPLFWYWMNIKAPGISLMGGSVPGVPAVISGTNGKVAWGLTNSYINSADAVFVKDLKEDDIESIRPTVKIKFWFLQIPFFFKSFEKLKTGQRILPLELENKNKIVLRWSGFSLKPEDIFSMFDLYKVENVTSFNDVATRIGLPSWNFAFADSKGDIGFRLVGKSYKHTGKTPFGIGTVTMDELQKEEFLDPSERPHVLKPARNYVYTANNRHWPKDSKYYGGRAYTSSIRAFRVDELLRDSKHDAQSFKKIQCDRQVVDARFFMDKFQKYVDEPVFKNWSMLAEDSSTVLPLYRRFFDLLLEKWSVNEYALYRILDKLSPTQIEEMKAILKLAHKEVNGRNWGDIHRLNFPHLSKNTDWVFSPDIAGVGDTYSVDPGTSKWNSDRKVYEQGSGASMRMIVELNKTPKIWLVLPGMNRNYDQKTNHSPWNAWKNCEFTEVEF